MGCPSLIIHIHDAHRPQAVDEICTPSRSCGPGVASPNSYIVDDGLFHREPREGECSAIVSREHLRFFMMVIEIV